MFICTTYTWPNQGLVHSKVPYFFFPRKSLGGTHSLNLGNFCFFFPILEKKNKLFFFSQEKFACHSLSWETVNLQKKVKTGKKWHFLSKFIFFRCFFFPQKFLPNSVFFFSQEKFTRHSLTRFSGPEKKNSPGKKKTPFSLTHSFFHQKVQILNFSGEKKYGTFGGVYGNW